MSLVPAIVTDFAVGHDVQVSLAMEAALPIEFVADPEIQVHPVWDANLKDLDDDLAAFMRDPQSGARRVAQLVFERVTHVRMGQFSAATGTVLARGESLFDIVPDDYGHFRRPYYPEVFDGLRRDVPGYVLDLMADEPVPASISERVAGIAVFRC